MGELGFEISQEARAELLVAEVLSTSEIEGERLDPAAVRSSVARQLGLPWGGAGPIDRRADGVVEILLDATRNHGQPLTVRRLQGWHAALFPTGYSGMHPIRVAGWRDDRTGPMQVVSGRVGRQKVHYEAPPAARVPGEMKRFLRWWQKSPGKLDGLLRAGVASLWFVAIHPFEDGNGRLARTLTDMALAQDERLETRFYSLSSQIMAERQAYYQVLEQTNRGSGDLTDWLAWFLGCLSRALSRSEKLLGTVLLKARFWSRHAETPLSDRQRKAISRLLAAGPGGFQGGLTNRKYAGLNHTSRATAQRELADLVQKGILRRNPGGGRSASYDLWWEEPPG